MKKTLILLASILALMAGCKQMTTQEKIAAYQAAEQKIEEECNAAMEAVQNDTTLTEDAQAAKMNDIESEAEKKISDLALSTIRENPSDSVALVALRYAFYMVEPADLKDALDCLSDEFKQDQFVQMIQSSLDAKLATAEGKPFADFTVQHVASIGKDGTPVYQEVKLSDYVGKGKYMLVDFWSPWCPPCKREIPNIKNVYEKYHGDDFDVLSVAVWESSRNMDYRNTIDTAAVYGVCWNQMNNAGKEPTEIYGIDGIPHIILFGPDGTILSRGLYGEKLQSAVSKALGR